MKAGSRKPVELGGPDHAPTNVEGVSVPRWLAAASALGWRSLVVVAAAALVVLALIELRLVTIPLVGALFISTLLAPPVSWLRRRGWPPLLAVWAVLVASILLIGGLFALLIPQVLSEVDEMGRAVRQGFEDVTAWLAEGPLSLSRADVREYLDRAGQQLRENADVFARGLLQGAVTAGEVVAGALLMLVLLIFFLKDGERISSWIVGQFSERHRHHVREIGQRAWSSLGAYLRGMTVIAFVDAVLIAIALLIIGVPLVLPLAVLTFLGGFLPLVGAVVAGAIAALVALVTGGVVDAALVAGATLVIQQVEGDVLAPVVLGRAVNLHALVIILALTVGAILGGVLGAFLGVPIAAVATAVGAYAKSQRAS